MRILKQSRRTGLSGTTTGLLVLGLLLTILHHADHVLRVDHSGWPFRSVVTPFTFSLLAYPMILFALLGPRRLIRERFAFLAIGTVLTLLAHAFIESPQMQYAMWADNRSLDPHAAGLHNLANIRSPVLGVAAVTIAMALNVTAAIATLGMLIDARRLRREAGG